MFKNALLYRIEHWDQPPLAQLEDALARARFIECGASQPESHGFVEPRGQDHSPLLESVGGQLILVRCSETKAVPGSAIKQELEAHLKRIEAETGRRPRGKAAKELKEQIVHALLPRAFPKRGSTVIWLDLKARLCVIGTGSVKKADGVVSHLVELLGGGFRLRPLQTQLAPATAMSQWLQAKEGPSGFAIDRDCELKQPDSEKATVRYARHTLDIDEVGEHIKAGKMPTQLALTWAGRVSFTLTEGGALRKIKLLDVVLESQSASEGDNGDFDSNVALLTGELRQLLPELVEALGGELDPAAGPAGTASAAVAGATATPATAPNTASNTRAASAEAAPWD